MALAKDLIGVGTPAAQAVAIVGGSVNTSVTAAGAGSTSSDATAVTSSYATVAGADGNKGVILPAVIEGEVTIFNNSASTLKVWPPSGAAIAVPGTGLGTANASYAHTTYAVVTYRAISATQWVPTKSA